MTIKKNIIWSKYISINISIETGSKINANSIMKDETSKELHKQYFKNQVSENPKKPSCA